jgi:hypothetical protein
MATVQNFQVMLGTQKCFGRDNEENISNITARIWQSNTCQPLYWITTIYIILTDVVNVLVHCENLEHD